MMFRLWDGLRLVNCRPINCLFIVTAMSACTAKKNDLKSLMLGQSGPIWSRYYKPCQSFGGKNVLLTCYLKYVLSSSGGIIWSEVVVMSICWVLVCFFFASPMDVNAAVTMVLQQTKIQRRNNSSFFFRFLVHDL